MAGTSNTAQRRMQIIRGLMRVLPKEGYEGATVAVIAQEAGLTPGLVHYHFKDKFQILTALAQFLAEGREAGLRELLDKETGGPLERMDDVVDFYLGQGAPADPDVVGCWIALISEGRRHLSIRRLVETTFSNLHALLRAELHEGRWQQAWGQRIDPDAVAAALVALIEGYLVLAATAPGLIPEGSAARTVKAMLRGVVGVSKTGRPLMIRPRSKVAASRA